MLEWTLQYTQLSAKVEKTDSLAKWKGFMREISMNVAYKTNKIPLQRIIDKLSAN